LLVTGWGELTLALANETAKARLIREVEILRFDDDVGQAFRNVGADRKA
jgi:hypothetical protein